MIDLQTGKEAATQVGSLLLSASLSTAVNAAARGLTREEMVECLVSPLREPSDFLAAFDELEKVAWYLHHTPEGRYYFDRQENLTKLLQSLANDAPDNQVDDLIRHRLQEMFRPERKSVYAEVLPLPKMEDVADKVRRNRVLIIVSPDAKIPPEEVQRFFDGLSQKNNLCVLTGDQTAMGSIEKAARQHFAAQKADSRIPKGHPQRADLETKQQTYEQDFNTTILALFGEVLPIQRARRPPQLVSKPLDTRDATQPFDGEAQIEKTLTAQPVKLFLDVEAEFDAIRDKAQDLLWPENIDEARWTDAADRYAEQAGMCSAAAARAGHAQGHRLQPWPVGRFRHRLCCPKSQEEAHFGAGDYRIAPMTAVRCACVSTPKMLVLRHVFLSPKRPRFRKQPAAFTDQTLTTSALRVNFLVVDPPDE